MKKRETGREDTRARVLKSACKQFSIKGLHETTVKAICREAKANVAAVNYYFGRKEDLYREVWRFSHDLMLEGHPLPDTDESSPEGWIRALIRSRVEAVHDDGPTGWFPRIVLKEMAEPRAMAQELRTTFLKPHLDRLLATVGTYLGEGATELQTRVCALSVHSQYVLMNIERGKGKPILGELKISRPEVEAIITQLQDFALAGMAAVKERLGNGC